MQNTPDIFFLHYLKGKLTNSMTKQIPVRHKNSNIYLATIETKPRLLSISEYLPKRNP